jgi:aryl-alcohol dehydrogenase-like predicted oxidoreductase
MGMAFLPSQGGQSDEESLKVLTAAADMGINFWITSDWYGPYTNELLIGRWFRETGRRDEIFICTKFGSQRVDGKMKVSGDAAYVKAACAASLERLGIESIDLYCQHRVDPDTPIEETVAAMVELKKEGKIRHLGLSECSARTLRRANAVHPIAAAEMEYSLFAMEIESEETAFLTTAREFGTKIVAYSPLGRGFLTGGIRKREDVDELRRNAFPRFSEANFPGNLRCVETVKSIAREKGCEPGQLALAWALAQGDGKWKRSCGGLETTC